MTIGHYDLTDLLRIVAVRLGPCCTVAGAFQLDCCCCTSDNGFDQLGLDRRLTLLLPLHHYYFYRRVRVEIIYKIQVKRRWGWDGQYYKHLEQIESTTIQKRFFIEWTYKKQCPARMTSPRIPPPPVAAVAAVILMIPASMLKLPVPVSIG